MITGGETELNYPPTYVCFDFSNEIWNCYLSASYRQTMQIQDTEKHELKVACGEIKETFTTIKIPLEISAIRSNHMTHRGLTDRCQIYTDHSCHPAPWQHLPIKALFLSLRGDSSRSRMWGLRDFFVPEVFGCSPLSHFTRMDAWSASLSKHGAQQSLTGKQNSIWVPLGTI